MEVTKFHIEQRNYLSTNTKNADKRFVSWQKRGDKDTRK